MKTIQQYSNNKELTREILAKIIQLNIPKHTRLSCFTYAGLAANNPKASIEHKLSKMYNKTLFVSPEICPKVYKTIKNNNLIHVNFGSSQHVINRSKHKYNFIWLDEYSFYNNRVESTISDILKTNRFKANAIFALTMCVQARYLNRGLMSEINNEQGIEVGLRVRLNKLGKRFNKSFKEIQTIRYSNNDVNSKAVPMKLFIFKVVNKVNNYDVYQAA